MDVKHRIKCPDATLPKGERIEAVLGQFNSWVTSDSFMGLIDIFGGDTNAFQNMSTVEILRWAKSFVTIWDYRKKQASAMTKEGEAARWLLNNDPFMLKNKDLIFKSAAELGLMGIRTSLFEAADYVLPLGGARMSNLRRCQIARATADSLNNAPTIVALSGMRPITDTERKGYVDTYAPAAETEFDAMSAGLRIAFGLKDDHSDLTGQSENPNLCSLVRQFSEKYNGSDLFAIAAPSSDPTRRANSADCFQFFFEQFVVPAGSKLINCTSQIYCPYQQVRALTFAVDHDVDFDTIGFPFDARDNTPGQVTDQPSEPVNYLQEIKGTVDAMNDFVDRFL